MSDDDDEWWDGFMTRLDELGDALRADREALRRREEVLAALPHVPAFRCPRCGITSYNKNDIREGYCGRCRDWTRG